MAMADQSVTIDSGTKRVYIDKSYFFSSPTVYFKADNQPRKTILKSSRWGDPPVLLPASETTYYVSRNRPVPTLDALDVLIVRGQKAWLVNSAAHLQQLGGIDGSQIKEWTGRWIELPDEQKCFLFSIRFKNDQTATYKIVEGSQSPATLVDDKFRPILSKLSSANDISGLLSSAQDTQYKWFPKQLGVARLAEVEARTSMLQAALEEKIYGQKRLIDGLAQLYKMSLMNPAKRVFTAVMMGPSGTGKSYSGETFAREIFGSDQYALKIDGTEYQDGIANGASEIHKLVGAPPALQGQQKGAITEWLRKNGGNGVLTINEGDKMHPDIWMRLMELLDNGEITAGDGGKIKANFLYIIVTTNRGSKRLFPRSVKTWSDEQIKKRVENVTTADLRELYETSVDANDKKVLPREVINRIDAWVLSQPISQEAAIKIASDEATSFLAQMKGIGLNIDIKQRVVDYLALTNFTASDDGRQIRRAVKTYLTNLFTEVGKVKLDDPNEIEVTLFKGDQNKVYLEARSGEKSVKVLGPQESNQNPLYDPQTVSRLKRIPDMIGARVIGQPEAVKSSSEALIAKLSRTNNDRATCLFFIGTSGNGKTELGRAIAEAGYGSIEHATVIPLGEVFTDADFNKVFGVQPGYVGSEQTRLFEEALIAHPNGGVIVFDEASNMGGGDRSRKSELFKKLYNISEEKTWTSPVNGKIYDLSKYVFVFTGNDGEELFQGLTSDDMLMKVWHSEKSRENVRALLLNAGIPQAFINRMADVVLMKPILSHEAQAISRKLFSRQVANYESANSGVKIEYDEGFVNQLATSFFTKDKGGRSIRDLTDVRLNSLFATALIDHGIPSDGLGSVTIRLEIRDNGLMKPYRFDNSPVHKVEVIAHVTDATGRTTAHTIDLTEFAFNRLLMHAEEAMATDYHEAGHAVVNDPQLTGKTLGYTTIRGGRAKDLKYLGYARYDLMPGRSGNMHRQSAIATIAQLSAGRIAQEMAGYPEDSGYSNDLEQIRKVATAYFVQWGLDKQLLGIRVNEKGEPILTPDQEKLLEQKMATLIGEGENLARLYLQKNWDLVRAVAAGLIKNNGSLDGEQFAAIQREVFARPVRKTYADYRRAKSRRRDKNKTCSQILTLKDMMDQAG